MNKEKAHEMFRVVDTATANVDSLMDEAINRISEIWE